jgi:hypothetical protein
MVLCSQALFFFCVSNLLILCDLSCFLPLTINYERCCVNAATRLFESLFLVKYEIKTRERPY